MGFHSNSDVDDCSQYLNGNSFLCNQKQGKNSGYHEYDQKRIQENEREMLQIYYIKVDNFFDKLLF